jgi:hypothetical protein
MSERSGVLLLRVGNVLAFIAVVVINSLAGGTRLLGGVNTADVSALYSSLITPAGFTFSIWGVIYALMAVFIFFQLLPTHRQDAFNGQVGYFFILSCLFNITWLLLWQYEYIIVSVVLIFALLAALIVIYLRLGVGKSEAPRAEKLCVHLPFSVYLGWITIASIADVSAALVSVDWNGLGMAPVIWAQLVTVIAVGITLFVLGTRRDPAYGLVITWALVGIAASQLGQLELLTVTEASAAVVAVATAAVLFLAFIRPTKNPPGRRSSGSALTKSRAYSAVLA